MKYVVKVTVDGKEIVSPAYDTREEAQSEQNRVLVVRKEHGQKHDIGVPAIYRVDPPAGMLMPDGEQAVPAED